jgi:xylan 1,4-beta-xylosidase
MTSRGRGRTFANPIIPGFHPDPSICRVGDDFFLVASSFEYFPGLPIFQSRDLVNWRQIGNVLTRKSQLDLDGVRSSGGIYAPTLRHAGGRFYVVTTHVDGGGNFLVTARRPEGPWSDPIWIDKEGIDPSLLFHDGRVFYTRNGKGTDYDHPFIHQTELDPKSGRRRGRMRVIWRGMGGVWPEAPHLYALRGRYYLLAAEGGTAYDHSELVARADSPYGPFVPGPRNPILTHRGRRGHPIQATGHVDLVTLDDRSAWAVFLGIRPLTGSAGRHHHLGRETFLAPVRFDDDGWPMIGEGGQVELRMRAPALAPHVFARPPARDDFDGPALAPGWISLRNPPAEAISLKERPGFLRLRGSAATLDEVGAPAFVGRRQQHFAVRCRAALDFAPRRPGDEAGLTVRAREDFHLDLAVRLGPRGQRQALAIRRTGGVSRVLGRTPLPAGPVNLEIAASAEAYQLSAAVGRRWIALGRVPTSALSTESLQKRGPMHFGGVAIGMYATGRGQPSTAPADFDWFEYREVTRSRPPAKGKGG